MDFLNLHPQSLGSDLDLGCIYISCLFIFLQNLLLLHSSLGVVVHNGLSLPLGHGGEDEDQLQVEMDLMVAGDVMEEPGLVSIFNRDPGLAEKTGDCRRSREV